MGGRLRYWRHRIGMSQKELSERSGIAQSRISEFENGRYDISGVTLRNAARLARALGIHAEDLLDEDADIKKTQEQTK